MTRDGRTPAGLCFDGARLTIVWRDVATRMPKTVSSPYRDGEDLSEAIEELASAAPAGADWHVTLLRPLAQSRTVALPAMSREAAEAVLSRDCARYVVVSDNNEHIASAERADRGRWRAAFAPSSTLDAITHAAEEQGWPVPHIRTADDALAGAVQVLVPSLARAPEVVAFVCVSEGPSDAVHLRGGAPWAGRRFIAPASDDVAIEFAQTGTAKGTPVVIFGDGPRAQSLARALGAAGMRATTVDTGLPPDATAEVTLALLGTLAAPLLPLRAAASRVLVAHRGRRVTRWLVAATIVALTAAVAIQRWRIQAALSEIAAQRAEIAAPVRSALGLRAQVDDANDLVREIAERETHASRAAGVLAAVTLALPANTMLSSLRVNGDSITIEGESRRSADVYEALRGLPSLEQVKLAAPLRQERQAGTADSTVEHFSYQARVRGVTR